MFQLSKATGNTFVQRGEEIGIRRIRLLLFIEFSFSSLPQTYEALAELGRIEIEMTTLKREFLRFPKDIQRRLWKELVYALANIYEVERLEEIKSHTVKVNVLDEGDRCTIFFWI